MNTFRDPSRLVTITLVAGLLVLRHRGTGLVFRGDWALRSHRDARVFGRVEGGQRPGPAALHLDGCGPGLAIRLTTSRGEQLLGPLVLQHETCQPLPCHPLLPAVWPAAAA